MVRRVLVRSPEFTGWEAVLRFNAIELPKLLTTLRMQSVDAGRIEAAGYFVLAQSPLTVVPFEFNWSQFLGPMKAKLKFAPEKSLSRPALLVDGYSEGAYGKEFYGLRSRGAELLELEEIDRESIFERSVRLFRGNYRKTKTIKFGKSHRHPRKLASFLATYSLDLKVSFEYPRAFLEQNIVEQAFYYVTGRSPVSPKECMERPSAKLHHYLSTILQNIETNEPTLYLW